MDNGVPFVKTILTKQPQMSPVGCWVLLEVLREVQATGDKLHRYNTNTELTAKCLRSCTMSQMNGY